MLSRRDFLLILELFATAFLLFMSVNVGTDLLTKGSTPTPDYEKTADAYLSSVDSRSLDMEDPKVGSFTTASLLTATKVAIITPDTDLFFRNLFVEWCTYQKFYYSVFPSFPTQEELEPFDIVLVGNMPITASDLPSLTAMTHKTRDVLFTQLPEYSVLEKSRGLRDFFGIRECVAENYKLESVHLLKDFLVSKERIYDADAMYDKSDQFSASENYYLLRSGYQILIQGVPEDTSISYYDYPSLLWQTRTNDADLFVVNTDLFDSKAMLGILTAMQAQTHSYYIYPVVDAQTISVLNFPLFASENEDVLQEMYSRDSISLSQDNIWPSVDKIFLTYKTDPSFFMTPRLDYDNLEEELDNRMVSFYRRGIFKRMGSLGLSADQVSDVSLSKKAALDESFLNENFSDLPFSTLYVPRKDLADANSYAPSSILLTDYAEDEPLLSMEADGTLVASFTENGYEHTIADDLRMVCLETALGLNNQQINIKSVLYPETSKDTWNYYSNQWSKAVTYQNDFSAFEHSTASRMGEKAANFLSLQYTTEELSDGIRLHIKSLEKETSFVLRLSGRTIESASNADYEKLTDTAYLIRCKDDTVDLHFADLDSLDANGETMEVIE